MTHKKIDFEKIRSSKFDQHVDKFGYSSNTCEICGRRTAEKLFVHMTNDGCLINVRDEEFVADSQGFFPIGSECAKKLPKEFIFE